MIEILTNTSVVLLTLCTATILLFVLRYLGTRWTTFEEGKHMMSFSVVLLMVLGTTLSYTIFGGAGHPVVWLWVQVIEFLLLLIVLLWRVSLLFRAQARIREHPMRRATDV